jgi:hypothetical protein
MKGHAPIGQPKNWGTLVDHNFFTSEADRARHLDSGGDAHSLAGDPMFVSPASGDFRVKDGSPALKAGFKNFPMDQFGVKKPSLKAIAKSPVIPTVLLGEGAAQTAAAPKLYWLGAPLHGLQGEEFSAFGVSKDDGGVQLVEVPAGSAAATAGLQTNDLIQGLNGKKVTDTGDLFAAIAATGASPLKLRVVRNQQARDLALPADTPFTIIESAKDTAGFVTLVPPSTPSGTPGTNVPTNNDPLSNLMDGKLAKSYGPIFANGVHDGAYKISLQAAQPIKAVTAWSYNQDGRRSRQFVTIYGSNSAADPGWNTADASKFKPLGSIDTGAPGDTTFVASSLRARDGQSLGTFRFIVWKVAPVTPGAENTAFQELAIETN